MSKINKKYIFLRKINYTGSKKKGEKV